MAGKDKCFAAAYGAACLHADLKASWIRWHAVPPDDCICKVWMCQKCIRQEQPEDGASGTAVPITSGHQAFAPSKAAKQAIVSRAHVMSKRIT